LASSRQYGNALLGVRHQEEEITAPHSPLSSSSANIVLEPDCVVDEEAAVACVVDEVNRVANDEDAVACALCAVACASSHILCLS